MSNVFQNYWQFSRRWGISVHALQLLSRNDQHEVLRGEGAEPGRSRAEPGAEPGSGVVIGGAGVRAEPGRSRAEPGSGRSRGQALLFVFRRWRRTRTLPGRSGPPASFGPVDPADRPARLRPRPDRPRPPDRRPPGGRGAASAGRHRHERPGPSRPRAGPRTASLPTSPIACTYRSRRPGGRNAIASGCRRSPAFRGTESIDFVSRRHDNTLRPLDSRACE